VGWASRSEIADKVWDLIMIAKSHPSLFEGDLALRLVEVFEDADCDTMEECAFVQKFLKWHEENEMWIQKF